MDIAERCTYFRCTRCGKEVFHLGTYFGMCGECHHLEALGIVTIQQYNKYLKTGGQNGSQS